MPYIGISDDRLHHILGVARKSYKIAKEMGYDEEFARKMFMLGYIHDVGYEFSTNQEEHSSESAKLYISLLDNDNETIKQGDIYKAIKDHGRYTQNKSIEWKILNMADMQVDNKGNEVDVMKRLEDIKQRYGEYSNQYLTACDICYQIGLTAINIAGNIY